MCFLFSSFSSQSALNNIFRKWEANIQGSKKAKASDAPEPDWVPAFFAPRPHSVDEDPTPFSVERVLRKKGTIIGGSWSAAEWSKSVITPRERAHVVKGSDDLQIKFLGAQAMASVIFLTYICI